MSQSPPSYFRIDTLSPSAPTGKTRKLEEKRCVPESRQDEEERREIADGLDPEKGETGNSRLARTKPLPYPPAAEPPARGGNPGQPH